MQAFIGAFVLYLSRSCWCVAACRRCSAPVAVVAPPLAFHATLFAMPGLFTTDMFSYVMYSHIAGPIGANPYTSHAVLVPGGSDLPLDPPALAQRALDLRAGLDRSDAAAGAGRGDARREVDKVLAYKALVNVGHLLGVGGAGVRRPPGAAGPRPRSGGACTPGTR